MSTVLDTTVLIDVLRGDDGAIAYLESLDEVPHCSEVVRVEVIRGLRSAERPPAERLFAALRWVPVSEAIARIAGELGRKYRTGHDLSTPDLLIAATAAHLGAVIATANVRHYPMMPGLRPPYRSA